MFATEQIEFLGYTLTVEGVRLNQKKMDAVEGIPRPISIKDISRFLGMVNFYHLHIQRMGTMC